jgi:hypothetical protein
MKAIDLLRKAKHSNSAYLNKEGDSSIYIFTYDELKDYVDLLISEAWENAAEKKYSPHKN